MHGVASIHFFKSQVKAKLRCSSEFFKLFEILWKQLFEYLVCLQCSLNSCLEQTLKQ